MAEKVRLLAPAKINLGLWVLGPRPDGYHEIITVLHKIALFDEIEVFPSETLEVLCDRCPSGPENLVWRAAELLGVKVKVRIKKRIPVGAGLGGGSADAGAFLKAFGKNLGQSKLLELAARLGSDVPFFVLEEKAALARGRGEALEPLKSNLRAWVKVLTPGFPISTRWAYGLLKERKAYADPEEAEETSSRLVDALKRGDIKGVAEAFFNSFEEPISEVYPEIRALKEELLKEGALVAGLSGSGSAVFGLFREPVLGSVPVIIER